MNPTTNHETAWLFPGQGSQVLGMGRELCRAFAPAHRILREAEEVSGLPLERLCWQGPGEELERTDALQPALTAISLGCLALLEDADQVPDCVAGHSLGEFAALCAAGVLSVEDTLFLVTLRGRLMHEASLHHPGGMVSVSGLPTQRVEALVDSLKERHRLCVANYNAPTQAVLSGEWEALELASTLAARQGGRVVRLPVSGAWHSPLMTEVHERFLDALGRVELRPPRIRCYLNTTGAPESDPECIAAELLAQVAAPVRWAGILSGMEAEGIRTFVEVGPGKVLRGLVRRNCDPRCAVYGVDGPRALEMLSRTRRGPAEAVLA
ncbi:MAG TPA: ACP S-malonyltransferase [Myxococcaceae bacterium]|nr:ACP S-malonyltransferase [Myxococcaceae bacterium]